MRSDDSASPHPGDATPALAVGVRRAPLVLVLWLGVIVGLNVGVPQLEKVIAQDNTAFVPAHADSIAAYTRMDDAFGTGETRSVVFVAGERPGGLTDDARTLWAFHFLQGTITRVDLATAADRGVLHPNGEWRLLSPAQMARRWRGREEGLRESLRIAEECEFDLLWMRPPLPRYPVPERHDDDSYLRQQTYAGARERWGETLSDAQAHQLEHELALIRKLGFAGFFLVMWDAMHFARGRGILCGRRALEHRQQLGLPRNPQPPLHLTIGNVRLE